MVLGRRVVRLPEVLLAVVPRVAVPQVAVIRVLWMLRVREGLPDPAGLSDLDPAVQAAACAEVISTFRRSWNGRRSLH